MNGGMDEWMSPVHPVYFTNFQMNTTEVDIQNLHANDNDILEYSGIKIEDEYFVKPPLPHWVYGICSVYLLTLTLLGVPLNLSILFLYCRTKKLHTAFNRLLVSLVFAEFICSAYGSPIDFIASYHNGWELGRELCTATGFMLTLLGMVSINSLTAISIYRWVIVYYDDNRVERNKLATLLTFLCWLLGGLFALPPLLGWGKYVPEQNGMSCAPSWVDPGENSYGLFLVLGGFLVPMLIIFATSASSVIAIRKHLISIKSDNIKWQAAKREKRVIIMVVVMVAVFLVCWSPYAIIVSISLIGRNKDIPLYWTVFPLMFAKCSTLWNPIIFFVLNKNFRDAASCHTPKWPKKLFHRRKDRTVQHTNAMSRKLRTSYGDMDITRMEETDFRSSNFSRSCGSRGSRGPTRDSVKYMRQNRGSQRRESQILLFNQTLASGNTQTTAIETTSF